jgi:Mn2+/Fe2+ NRAMP family transporter
MATPPLVFLLLLITNNKKIMGDYTNSRLSNALGLIIGLFMSLAVGILLWTLLM